MTAVRLTTWQGELRPGKVKMPVMNTGFLIYYFSYNVI